VKKGGSIPRIEDGAEGLRTSPCESLVSLQKSVPLNAVIRP